MDRGHPRTPGAGFPRRTRNTRPGHHAHTPIAGLDAHSVGPRPLPPEDTVNRYALGVDPGGQHTGIVLAELRPDGPVPVDGVTLDRTEEEKDIRHMGAPRFVRRVIEACMDMLAKHSVADDAVQVMVETMLPPTPVQPGTSIVPMAIWRHALGAWAVLGGVAAVWPDARLVAPAAADHHAEYPDVLKGRTPAGWTAGGSQRQHQRAAWAVLLSGIAQLGNIPATAPEPTFVASPAPELTPVDRVAALVTAGGAMSVSALLDAAGTVWVEGTVSDRVALALAAATALRPETDQARMRARLTARAAELEDIAAEN